MKKSAQIAYDELHRYFGLRARDGYLNLATGNTGNATISGPAGAMASIYQDLFSDSDSNPTIVEICEKIGGLASQSRDMSSVIKKTFCLTPYDDELSTLKAEKENLPLNTQSPEYKEQGLFSKDKPDAEIQQSGNLFTIKNISPKKSIESGHRIDAIQVFPIRSAPENSDAEILTLFLSTINSVNMSLAVPFVDISVSVSSAKNEKGNMQFSFGRFLGANENDKDVNADFLLKPTSTTLSLKKGNTLKTVSSMEIFTSPQTSVNAENVRYNENMGNAVRKDAFRPFMSLESLNLHVIPAGAGAISFKTAEMKVKLFDRGRLSDIAPLVAPSKFKSVQIDIEYGWSHPAGNNVANRADAKDINDRIGQLIDSMRVKESYTVVNSSFSFEQDGSVSIDIKLSMLGASRLTSEQLTFDDKSVTVQHLYDILEDIKRTVAGASSKSITLPQVISGGVDTFLALKNEDLQEIRKFRSILSKEKGALGGLSRQIARLIGSKNDTKGSELSRFQSSRKQAAADFITSLKNSDDPFLRKDGLSPAGVQRNEIVSGKYASLGAVLISALGSHLQQLGDVIFVFGCFNSSAAAMHDHNISQFPIRLSDKKDKNTLTLQRVLEHHYKRYSSLTPQTFIEMINEAFILQQSAEAYGLSDVYAPTEIVDESGEIKEKLVKSSRSKDEKENAASQLLIEKQKTENLDRIYGEGQRIRPSFTIPRLNIKIDTKLSSDGSKNVTRVIVTDQAASNVGDIQQLFNDVTTQGFYLKDHVSNVASGIRGACHGEITKLAEQELHNMMLLEKWTSSENKTLKQALEEKISPSTFATGTEEERLVKELDNIMFVKNFKSGDVKLRDVFYKFFPTIIYGSMGSGIISAQLSSQQNDALMTINATKQWQGAQTEDDKPTDLPMLIHPTQLSMEVFGTPLFKYSQKFFIDFGTGTSADNFYAVTGVDMSFGPGEFKCSLKMTQLDSFGRFMKIRDNAIGALISMLRQEQMTKSGQSTNR